MAEWTAEHVVAAAEAAALVGGQFPELRDAPVEQLATGWDNTVYLIDGWVFRFPRREIAVPGVRREIAVLPTLSTRLPLPVPLPELIGTPTAAYPWPFWGSRLLPGRELAESGLLDAERVPAAGAAGEFLRALHDSDLIGVLAGAAAALPVDPMRRGDPALRAERARPRLAELQRRGLWEPDPAVERLLADAAKLGPPTSRPVLAHGDLHVRHLLVDRAGGAAGVIDWGDVCLADPAVDLSLAYGAFSGPARAALLAGYGPVPPDRELRARTLAVFLCATLAAYAAAENRPRLLRESLAGLRRAVAD